MALICGLLDCWWSRVCPNAGELLCCPGPPAAVAAHYQVHRCSIFATYGLTKHALSPSCCHNMNIVRPSDQSWGCCTPASSPMPFKFASVDSHTELCCYSHDILGWHVNYISTWSWYESPEIWDLNHCGLRTPISSFNPRSESASPEVDEFVLLHNVFLFQQHLVGHNMYRYRFPSVFKQSAPLRWRKGRYGAKETMAHWGPGGAPEEGCMCARMRHQTHTKPDDASMWEIVPPVEPWSATGWWPSLTPKTQEAPPSIEASPVLGCQGT